jgi:hypothetical protein
MLVAFILVLVSAICAVAFPLATYTFTLATFGLTHVLTELHYVENRFDQRLSHNLRLRILWLLLFIVGFRTLQVFDLIPIWASVPIELSCVLGLVLLVIPVLGKKDWRLVTLAIAICAILTLGIFWTSTIILLLFANLHNFTPIGFIFEKLQGREKRRAILPCLLVFAAIPLVILSGLPDHLLSSIGLVSWDVSLFPIGDLESYLGAYVPPLFDGAIAIHLFSAAVFLQSMHYAVVIGILPKWENPSKKPANNHLPPFWYQQNQFRWLVLFLSILLLIVFIKSFTHARAIYGIAAAFHAWLEIPILLLALVLPKEDNLHIE